MLRRLLIGSLLALAPLALPARAAGESAPAAALADAPSPYLREHADNLVAWRTWGPAAFAEARETNRPIFLSIGYMACHWCHVMEEVNFMNPRVAAFINAHFIPVLVDRERRPDVDEIHMLATQALTGRGGWPNNLFLTPDLEPFFAHGYVPASRMLKIARAVRDQWREDEKGLRAEAARIAALLRSHQNRRMSAPMPDAARLRELAADLAGRFDPFFGGLGSGPKFFRQPVLMFLGRVALMDGDEAARTAFLNTLEHAARGAVMDQIAGGFHRYAVDGRWNLPHFEKMLYTQALMSRAYLYAWRLSGRDFFARVARRTLDYVLADLRAPQGAFHAARDADSQGGEGAFYVWTPRQLRRVLGAKDAAFALRLFGRVPYGELAGEVIPNRIEARKEDEGRLRAILDKLAAARARRLPPRRDEKIIAAWNGLMIAALADAALTLESSRYGRAAARAADFVWENLRDADGRLRRIWLDGAAHAPAMLDDYAYLAEAMLALHDLDGREKWLRRARELVDGMLVIFGDDEGGGLWFAPVRNGYARARPGRDSALPSPQAAALRALVRLSRRVDDGGKYRRRAEALARTLAAPALSRPEEGAAALRAIDEMLRGPDGPARYVDGGVARLRLSRRGENVVVRMRLKPGWHVNAHRPGNENYIPTRLWLAPPPGAAKSVPPPSLADVRYPAPARLRTAFSDKPLLLLSGAFEISARLPERSRKALAAPARLKLELQICGEEICLPPRTLTLPLPPPLPPAVSIR